MTLYVDGAPYHVEERNVPPPLNVEPPIPYSGFLLGDGTWIYREANEIQGLQRGGWGSVSGAWYDVTHNHCLPLDEYCLIINYDPVYDETCGHGPDQLIF